MQFFNLRLIASRALPIAALVLSVALPAAAQGHDHGKHGEKAGHSHAKAEGHGGAVTMTKAHHFEVVYTEKGVHIYVYDSSQNAVDPKGSSGEVTFKFKAKGKPSATVALKYVGGAEHGDHDDDHGEKGEHGDHDDDHGEKGEHGDHDDDHDGAVGHLEAAVNLAGISKGGAKAKFTITGLAHKKEARVSFRASFALTKMAEYTCPMKCVAPSHEAGKCPKCGMTLKGSKFLYSCPMHPAVQSQSAKTKCWTCGMALVKDTGAKKAAKGHGGHDHGSH